MFPEAKWLDALKLPLNATAAIAVASTALAILDLSGLLDLGPLGAFARPVLIIISVVFSTLSMVGLIEYLLTPLREKRRLHTLSTRRAVRRKEEDERRVVKQEQIIARLDGDPLCGR